MQKGKYNTTTGRQEVDINSGGSSTSGVEYNVTPPTATDGTTGAAQGDINRNTKVAEQYAPSAEDNAVGVIKVEKRYSGVKITSDTLIKTGAGFLHSLTFSCNDAAPTAGSIIVYDNTAESGTEIFNHTFTTTPFVPFTVTPDVTFGTGLYIGFTTTADVNVLPSWR